MSKFLYPIKNLEIMPWIKYWLLKRGSSPSYPLSEITTGTSPLTLLNSVRKKFNIFNIGGNTIQDGTPTPEAPIPVENVSGEVEVKVENKNLCSSETIGNNNPVLSNISGHYTGAITIAVKTSSGAAQVNYRIVYEDGTTYNNYIMTANQANNVWRIAKYTAPKPIAKIGLYYISTGGTRTAEHIMFLKGTYNTITDADYVPHKEQTATLSLPEGMEMCKSAYGEHTDDFIKQEDKWYKYKQNVKKRLLATNVNSIGGIDSTKGFIVLTGITNKLNNASLWCNYFTNISLVGGEDNSNKIGIANINTDETLRFRYKTGELTLAGAREFLTNNEVILQYRLKEPVLEEITDPTLISDLENLKNLYSYKGTTYISSTNAPSPVFEVQYYMEGE